MSPAYRAPQSCPVCSGRLHVTQLGCPSCGTGLTGEFRPCEFCGLDDADRDLLRVFLSSRGNMKDVERHLGVSYPTARARFDDLLRRLGLAAGVPGPTGPGSPLPAAPVPLPPLPPLGAPGPMPAAPGPAPAPPAPGRPVQPGPRAQDPRLATLQALASGELDVETARTRLGGGSAARP